MKADTESTETGSNACSEAMGDGEGEDMIHLRREIDRIRTSESSKYVLVEPPLSSPRTYATVAERAVRQISGGTALAFMQGS